MNMPGFRAEASLERTKNLYHTAGTFSQADGAIRPAIVPRPNNCISRCDYCLGICRGDFRCIISCAGSCASYCLIGDPILGF